MKIRRLILVSGTFCNMLGCSAYPDSYLSTEAACAPDFEGALAADTLDYSNEARHSLKGSDQLPTLTGQRIEVQESEEIWGVGIRVTRTGDGIGETQITIRNDVPVTPSSMPGSTIIGLKSIAESVIPTTDFDWVYVPMNTTLTQGYHWIAVHAGYGENSTNTLEWSNLSGDSFGEYDPTTNLWLPVVEVDDEGNSQTRRASFRTITCQK